MEFQTADNYNPDILPKIKKTKKSGTKKSGKLTNILKPNDSKILLQLKTNPEGLRVETISKLTGIPLRTTYRIINKYSKNNNRQLIEKVGNIYKKTNGQVEFWQKLSGDNNIYELHNLSYVLHLIETPEWWKKRKSRLMKLKGWQFSNHNFGKNNSNPYQQILNENFVIQTYPESIIIIHRKRYYSDNPYEIIQDGMIESIELIRFLEERFKFRFFPDGVPAMEIRGNDFNDLESFIAKYCKDKGKRGFLVETKVGNIWVDFSHPYGLETNTPDLQNTLKRYSKDLAENKPKLNSELQKEIEENKTESLNQFNEAFSLIKQSSQLMLDSEMRFKQLENRLRGQEVLIYQLVEEVKKWKK